MEVCSPTMASKPYSVGPHHGVARIIKKKTSKCFEAFIPVFSIILYNPL